MEFDSTPFAAGAVRIVESKLEGHLGGLIRDFPVAAQHRSALKALGSDFVYAAKSPLLNDRGSWFALVRFGNVIERRFGFTREVIAYYSPHHDLQLRTYKRLADLVEEAPRPATPDVFLMWSPDPMTAVRLNDWSSRESHVAIALPKADDVDAASGLWGNIVNRLTQLNLYDQTLPVTGNDFFGRQGAIRLLADHLTSGRVSGVFGLRKTGKTSLVTELGRRVTKASGVKQIFVLRDLETLPSNPDDQVTTLLGDLKVNLLAQLRAQALRTHELADLDAYPSISAFRRALHTLLGHVRKQDVNIFLALDEIESLIGSASSWSGSRPQVAELLGTLRALVQENDNFNVVVSGLTSGILEQGELFERENPFFAWASTVFIPPLTAIESKDILGHLGERMAVTWNDDASQRAAEIADGHVFLLRTLAARVVETLPAGLSDRHVSLETLEATRRKWRRSVAGQVEEMLASVGRYYPDEAGLLSILRNDFSHMNEFEDEYPGLVNHLVQLGLLSESLDGTLRLSALAEFGR